MLNGVSLLFSVMFSSFVLVPILYFSNRTVSSL